MKTATNFRQKAEQRNNKITRYSKNWQRLRPSNVVMAAFSWRQSLEITSTQSICQTLFPQTDWQHFANYMGSCKLTVVEFRNLFPDFYFGKHLTFFHSPPTWFQYVVDFQLEKNVKQGRKLELTYLYACWIMHMKCC